MASLHHPDSQRKCPPSNVQQPASDLVSIAILAISTYNCLWVRIAGSHAPYPRMYRLYSILFSLGLVLMAPYYLWRHRRRKELAGWRERLGKLPANFRQQASGAIWIHAVSVGETLAVAGLVKQLLERYPDRKIFLSSVTAA
ncbi:MAG TPA: glycosyltransferase N-terminal domain-containing protein, partial [Terriglobia bacterium]|nr:glycosyltransferase N-terminal domain-containing protein [Terriglobia bacterium]